MVHTLIIGDIQSVACTGTIIIPPADRLTGCCHRHTASIRPHLSSPSTSRKGLSRLHQSLAIHQSTSSRSSSTHFLDFSPPPHLLNESTHDQKESENHPPPAGTCSAFNLKDLSTEPEGPSSLAAGAASSVAPSLLSLDFSPLPPPPRPHQLPAPRLLYPRRTRLCVQYCHRLRQARFNRPWDPIPRSASWFSDGHYFPKAPSASHLLAQGQSCQSSSQSRDPVANLRASLRVCWIPASTLRTLPLLALAGSADYSSDPGLPTDTDHGQHKHKQPGPSPRPKSLSTSPHPLNPTSPIPYQTLPDHPPPARQTTSYRLLRESPSLIISLFRFPKRFSHFAFTLSFLSQVRTSKASPSSTPKHTSPTPITGTYLDNSI
ncbi:hypothetical protein BDZ45DRAFT_739803 [Acephala macrosclerotiorum]|nr:hypothetical protein BDZ45DRAFT_739803 [Acephala macrosclerotiorum]